ncbi:iron ABC transporter substrate-binding protein [Merismopedia glauca]|uniref:Iron ABC transporter substrate-binding protein n=1 Tax=Merismopedia glauca CCAP 1448/3 TaxID=1296344 RepID=A0A2T1C9T8_9CYAN|nr:iron ABC transporter substrate-binding protein [Merismopedia glauca]PSB05030.1 iron ABC transporter substrate-binding protein [Merismopedia glauca CCAP 1448/3]
MKRRQAIFLLGLATVSGGLAIACSNQTPNTANVGGGTNSQELTIYSGRSKKLIDPLIQQFQQKTGIKTQIRYASTAELAATIQEEGKNSPADVFFAQDAGALGAIQKAGLATKLPDKFLNQVEPRFHSPDGMWVGISGRVRTLDYNTKLVKPTDLPNTVVGLTEAKWKGKVGWAPSNGSFQAFVTALRVSVGEAKAKQWLEAMKANDTKVYENNVQILEALSKGEVTVGLVNHYYLEELKKENPQVPVAHHFLNDVGSMVNVAGVAILNTSKHREAADKLVEFLLTPEAQKYFAEETYEYPLADGVKPATNVKSLAEIKTPKLDLSNLDDLKGTLKLLEQTGVL